MIAHSLGVRHVIQPLVPTGRYCYMDVLQKIQGAAPLLRADQPAQLQTISSSLRDHLSAWQLALGSHPDKDFVSYILEGISCGIRVEFDYSRSQCPAWRNMPSTKDRVEVIETYLAGEVPAGRIIGPLSSSTTSKVKVQINPLGVVPKGRTFSKWRLITDLSFPESQSVNDGIDPLVCSLRYTTVDKVAQAAGCLEVGTLLAKLDVCSAYCLIPVHPDDCPSIGFQWQGVQYVDGMLPFGLRSALMIFTAVADARRSTITWMTLSRMGRMPQKTAKRSSILSSKRPRILASP